MKVVFQSIGYEASVWCPSKGRMADTIAYDSETTVIEDPADVPEFVIASAFDGHKVYFIRRPDLLRFWETHGGSRVFMHSAGFDMEVAAKACGFDFGVMTESKLIVDVSILYRLLKCAKTGDIPRRFSLQLMSGELLGVALDKQDGTRTDFGRFLRNGSVDYASIPSAHLQYAASDAIATYLLGEVLIPLCRNEHLRHTPLPLNGTNGTNGITAPLWGWLGHDIQLMGDVALRAIERNGLGVDMDRVKAAEQTLAGEVDAARDTLARRGYVQGQKGNRAVYDGIMSELERQHGVTLPRSAKTCAVSQVEKDLEPLVGDEFVDAFLKVKRLDKIGQTYLRPFKTAGGRVHPRYNLMVRTGRTSCSAPNVQNLPREGGVRECVVPASGHVFIGCDYAALELCTLAQITYSRYGRSVMRDLINSGTDLHRHVAAMVLGKPDSEVTKAERQKAKAINFGLPGGMGVERLQKYARDSFGVELTPDEAERWRSAWMSMFPEMQQFLKQEDDLTRFGEKLDLGSHPGDRQPSPASAAAVVIRVAGGASETSKGRVFAKDETDWAWEQIADSRAGRQKAFVADIEARRGSRDLQRAVVPGRTVSIPTGRVCADSSYTESHNWPFQALAADGAKLALYGLVRAGYRVAAFIHDEVLVEVPERDDYREIAEDISRIMVVAMQKVCPDVAIKTEYAVMRRWHKDAKAAYDHAGRLIPHGDAASIK